MATSLCLVSIFSLIICYSHHHLSCITFLVNLDLNLISHNLNLWGLFWFLKYVLSFWFFSSWVRAPQWAMFFQTPRVGSHWVVVVETCIIINNRLLYPKSYNLINKSLLLLDYVFYFKPLRNKTMEN